MKSLTRETYQVIRLNLKNIVLFELVYRLLTLPIYLQLVNKSVKFALKMAGYSYLTAGNIGMFFLKPWTILTILATAVIGMLILVIEMGALLTSFQGAAYFRKTDFVEMLCGGFGKLWDEVKRRNVRLFLLALADFLLINLYLIYRTLAHVKPVNFVMAELMKRPLGCLGLFLAGVALVAVAAPGIFAFHGCMVEQKNFKDAYRRSKELMKGRRIKTFIPLTGYSLLLVAAVYAVYAVCITAAAVFAEVFTERNLALAVLPAVCDRVEIALIFIGSTVLAVVLVAAVTVQYYQYASRIRHEARWSFAYPVKKAAKRRITAVIALVMAISLFMVYDAVRNGSALADDVLKEIQITAHRGSSKSAPENTMAALAAAEEELADFAEIDVQETKDGVIVLCHDANLKRVAGISRAVGSMTFEELEKLDAGSRFSEDFAGEKIPSLQEVMEFCKGRLNLNIEIKNMGKASALPEKVLAMIEEYGMEEQCVVTSTSLRYLKRIKGLNPDIRTGYIVSAAYGDYYSSSDIDFISLRSSFVSEKLVETVHEQGKAVHAWTVNSKSELERMKLLKVDNIITDYPVLAREMVYREEATETLLEYIRLVFR